ncbi:hypothetical protein [Escherichia phage 18-1-2]|nr:hypothetical protein [Escherichia phage 18-1-2]UJQ87377.1 hypothetical protein [Escherichia phage 24-2-1]UJQ87554.1 hypothetical protein [Escherichia phage 19-1-2]
MCQFLIGYVLYIFCTIVWCVEFGWQFPRRGRVGYGGEQGHG